MSEFLSAEKILLPENHFPPLHQGLLAEKVKAAGGSMASTRDEATIVLLNPSSGNYQSEVDFAARLHASYPAVRQPKLYPYHWLLSSLHASAPLPVSRLAFAAPVFTHPDRTRDHAPLLAWVSINIHRLEGEEPATAQRNVATLLESGGALVVPKRALADLLVVDLSSKFAETVRAEKDRHGRTHQRIAERDWVEDCVRHARLAWPRSTEKRRRAGPAGGEGHGDGNGEEEPGADGDGESEDSMAAEDEADRARHEGRGPGRPTGKPRIEYTPQDDDFLCRYLAAHHPDGSWHSRKTYQLLVSYASTYPIADRHSAQSWHERFKKNAGPLSRRIERFAREGVDGTLKTRAEREKARAEKEAREAEARAADAPADSRSQSHPQPIPLPAQAATGEVAEGSGSRAQREGARATRAAMRALEGEAGPAQVVPALATVGAAQVEVVPVKGGQEGEDVPSGSNDKKRVLVESESDDERDPPVPVVSKDAPVLATSEAALAPATIQAAPVSPTSQAAPAPATHDDVEMVNANSDLAATTGDINSIRALNGTAEPPLIITTAQVEASTVTVAQVITETTASQRTPHALTGTHEPLLVQGMGMEEAHTQNGGAESLSLPRDGFETQAILDDYARVRAPSAPLVSSGFPVGPVTESAQAPQTAQAPAPIPSPISTVPTTHLSVPAVEHPTYRSSGAHVRPPPLVAPQVSENRSQHSGAGADATPGAPAPDMSTPHRRPRISLFREELLSSSKRRRTSTPDRRKSKPGAKGRSSSPDKVYISTFIPPASRTPNPEEVETEARRSSVRASSPILSDAERMERIIKGRELVERRKEEYKAKIREYGARYGIGPMDVFGVVNEVVRRRAGGAGAGVDWAEVERGFRERYGR